MIGTTLSHYEITAELGRGGMGIVYKARDIKLDREVAIKILPSAALASKDDRERFYREAKSAAQLHHPNIASVFEIDEAVPEGGDAAEPRPFIAMEYIAGGTLQDKIKEAPLKLSDAVKIASQVAEALKAAHAKDIVHRDIKSANVMITEDGVAKVLDFGLAKTNQSTMLTRMGSTLGTVAYMSPEQARGQEVDGRTDLYSLGTMLYEMVAGRLPFAGEYEQAVVYSILNEPPEPLTSLRTGVPMQLEWIVNKLLAKDAEYRYQSAADLLADLKSLDLSGSGQTRQSMPAMSGRAPAAPITAQDASSTSKTWKYVSAVLVLAVAVMAVLLLMPSGADRQPELGTMRFQLSVPSKDGMKALKISPKGAYLGVLYNNDDLLIRTLATGEDRVFNLPGANTFEFSQDEEKVLISGLRELIQMNVDGSERIVMAETDSWNWAIFGPRNEVLYSVYGQFAVRIPPVGRRDTLRIDVQGALFPMNVVPDGRVLFTAFETGAPRSSYLWDPEGNEFERLDHDAFDILPSGHGVFQSLDGQITSIAALDENASVISDTRPIPYLNHTFWQSSENGILVSVPEGGVSSWELVSRARNGTDVVLEPEIAAEWFGVSSDETRLVFETDGGSMTVLDVTNGLTSPIASGVSIEYPVWSIDDERVYGFVSDDLTVTPSNRSEPPDLIFETLQAVGPISWFPDGNRFLMSRWSTDDALLLNLIEFDLQADSVIQEIQSDGMTAGPSVHPDGAFFAYFVVGSTSEDPPLTIREVSTDRTWQLPLGQDAGMVRWSADGSSIEYRQGDSLMAMPVSIENGFRTTGPPEVIAILPSLAVWHRTQDGTVFYSRRKSSGSDDSQDGGSMIIDVVVNWFDELERIAPIREK